MYISLISLMFPGLLHIMVVKRLIRSVYGERINKEHWILFLRAGYFLPYTAIDFQVHRCRPVVIRGNCTCHELEGGSSTSYYSRLLAVLFLQLSTFPLFSYSFSAVSTASLYTRICIRPNGVREPLPPGHCDWLRYDSWPKLGQWEPLSETFL